MYIISFILLILLSLLVFSKSEHFHSLSKQEKFSRCLSDMKKILDKNNTSFFLCYGTLLGQRRENKFIEYDHDIDIGIIRNNYDNSVKDKILESGLFKFNKEFGNLKDCYECSFIHKATNTPIDIFIFYKIKDDLYYSASHTGICNYTKYGYCKWGRHLRGFKYINFMNESYRVPANTDEFLVESYGKDWNIPKQFNYTDGILLGHYKNMIK